MVNQVEGHEYIAKMIKDYGESHVFYMEASLRLVLQDLERYGIKPIMAHTENGAGYMADGYARVTGKVGICMAQSIGAGNMVGGITDAYLACSPVMAITGKKIPVLQKRNGYQEYDHILMYEGITKYNADISDPQQLPYMFRQAMRKATSGKPRPVHLDVTNNLGRTIEVAKIKGETLVAEKFGKCPAVRPMADEKSIEDAVRAIEISKRPIIVAGRGVVISRAGKAVVEFAKKADIPLITTPDAKGIVDENDDIWGGVNGDYGMDCANRSLVEADLVIFIGTQTNDQSTCDWKCPPASVKTIQIDIEFGELGRNYVDCIGLAGDARTVVAQLIEKVKAADREEWRKTVMAHVKDTLDEYAESRSTGSDLIRPDALCYEISKAIPDDAVVVSDTGYAAVWTATSLRMKATQKYIRAAGSLGWALPGSLGVKCGVGDRPVIAFIGDGGMYYHLVELESAVKYGINTVTVINNNGIFAQCSGDIKSIYMDDPQTGKKHYTFGDIDFTKIAREFGCFALKVEKLRDVGDAIKSALAANKPAVVEVITDPDTKRPPALKGVTGSMAGIVEGLD